MIVCANGNGEKKSNTRQALGRMAGVAAGNGFVGEMLVDHDYRIAEIEKRLAPSTAGQESPTEPKFYTDEDIAEANRRAAEYMQWQREKDQAARRRAGEYRVQSVAAAVRVATPEQPETPAESTESMVHPGLSETLAQYEQFRTEFDGDLQDRQRKRRDEDHPPLQPPRKFYGVLSHRISRHAERWQIVVVAESIQQAIEQAIDRMQAIGLDFGQPRFDAQQGGPAEYEVTSVVMIGPVNCRRASGLVELWSAGATIAGYRVFQDEDEEGAA